MTNKFIAGLVAAAAAFLPAPALADGLLLQAYPEHYELFQTLEDVGVTMVINDPMRCGEGSQGLYGWNGEAGFAVLIVCQDNGVPGGLEVEWTANDLDTLRHEAHHVVQDCLVGPFGDGRLALLFNSPEKMADFLELSNATEEQVKNILKVYSDQDEETQWREVEAMFVARGVDAEAIAEAVRRQCRN